MSNRRRTAFLALVLAAEATTACSVTHLDAIGTAAADASIDAPGEVALADRSPVIDSDSPGADGMSDAIALDAGPDSSNETPDAFADGDAMTDGSSLACMSAQNPIREWNFEGDAQGWTLATDDGSRNGNTPVEGTVSWTNSVGIPMAGALQVDITPGTMNGAWVRYPTPLGSLSGRTVSAWIWLASGPTPHVKLFVQTGTQFAWGDGGTVLLTPNQWTCITLNVSSPDYNGPNYDPDNVVSLGFELLGTEPFRVYLDTIRYE